MLHRVKEKMAVSRPQRNRAPLPFMLFVYTSPIYDSDTGILSTYF